MVVLLKGIVGLTEVCRFRRPWGLICWFCAFQAALNVDMGKRYNVFFRGLVLGDEMGKGYAA